MKYVVKMSYTDGDTYLKQPGDGDCYGSELKDARRFDLLEAVFETMRLTREIDSTDLVLPVYYICPVVTK